MGVLVVTRWNHPWKFSHGSPEKNPKKLIWFQSSPKHPPPPMTLGSMFILRGGLGFLEFLVHDRMGSQPPAPWHPDHSRTMPSPLKTTRAAPGTEIQISKSLKSQIGKKKGGFLKFFTAFYSLKKIQVSGGGNSNIFQHFPPWSKGKIPHFEAHIFQMAWFSHQLEMPKQVCGLDFGDGRNHAPVEVGQLIPLAGFL